MDPSGMLTFRLCDFKKDIADSYSILANLKVLSVASRGNSFISSVSVSKTLPLRSTETNRELGINHITEAVGLSTNAGNYNRD